MVLQALSGNSAGNAAAQRRVFDAMPAPVFTCDAAGRFTYVNAAWRQLLGYTDDELLALDFEDLADEATVREWREAVAQVSDGLDGFTCENQLRHRDGSPRWLACNVRAVREDDGALRGLLGVAMDVGKRKRGEVLQAGLRDVLEQMALGAGLPQVLLRLTEVIEAALDYGARASIQLVTDDGRHLAPAAAPNLPPDYLDEAGGLSIAEGAGNCGTAAFRREPVFVTDTRRDPLWRDFQPLAARYDIGAAWSMPIVSGRGRLLGTFAVYYREPRRPTHAERTMLELASRSAMVALERVQAEDALRARGEQFRRAIQDAPIPVMLHAEDGQVLQLSNVWTELTGYTLGDTKALRRLLARAYGADEHDLGPAVQRLFGHEGAAQLQTELPVETRNGQRLTWTLSASSPGQLRDGRRFVVAMAVDITERKRTERQLRASEERASLATRVAQVGIWSWEPDTNHFEADPRCREILGVPADAPMAFDPGMPHLHPDDRELARRGLELALDPQGSGHYEAELRVLRADGSMRWISGRAQCVFRGSGRRRRPALLLGSLIDITESKHMQESLLEADRRKDEFLATLAHELRNPLAPLRNCLHVLKMHDVDDPHAARLHAMMDRQVAQMVRLVDDLLEVSRITRGNVELRKRPVALAEILSSAVETSRPLLDQGGHRIEVHTPPPTVMLHADPMRLEQVFTNLLNNAAKYTPPGGRIVVKTRVEDGMAQVSVCDNGIGLPAEMLVQVFDMFTQCEHSRSQAQGGLGIGLTLVRSLVEQHGGRVEARSEGLGFGSEFIVHLPLLQHAHDARSESLAPPPLVPHPRSVLVADDNHESADSMALFLRLSGHDVRTVYDGRACLEAIGEARPDVVLLDIGMPLLDGYETCRRIRALPDGDDIIVFATTGWGQDADRERSSAVGFDAHLVKPVDPGALLARLDALPEHHSRPAH
ncbi:MAG TPA: PAS domain S-box protein [Xanthomonadaceae bacterium]|nr:PAS domain S-box protein [Xanthomonadaceae bacterium]